MSYGAPLCIWAKKLPDDPRIRLHVTPDCFSNPAVISLSAGPRSAAAAMVSCFDCPNARTEVSSTKTALRANNHHLCRFDKCGRRLAFLKPHFVYRIGCDDRRDDLPA